MGRVSPWVLVTVVSNRVRISLSLLDIRMLRSSRDDTPISTGFENRKPKIETTALVSIVVVGSCAFSPFVSSPSPISTSSTPPTHLPSHRSSSKLDPYILQNPEIHRFPKSHTACTKDRDAHSTAPRSVYGTLPRHKPANYSADKPRPGATDTTFAPSIVVSLTDCSRGECKDTPRITTPQLWGFVRTDVSDLELQGRCG